MKYIISKVINFPGSEKIYCLENEKEKLFIKASQLKKKYKKVKSAIETVDYYQELSNIKDKVMERINKINDVLRWSEARINGLEKGTPEYEKIQQDIDKYTEDDKYWKKVLEDVTDKIVEFQTLQSRVTLERQISLQELYNSLGLSQDELNDKINDKEVQLIKEDENSPDSSEDETPSEPEEIEVEKDVKIKK